MNEPLCLGVETSCDETSLALVRGGRVLSEITASQADVFALFGGVVPEIASREHYRVLGPLFTELLDSASFSPLDIDVVAVARGPGLLGSLLTGLGFAKGVAMGSGARLVGVNHLYAHLLAPGLEQAMAFPALGLLVSGGHTHLYRVDTETAFTRLGRTLDDAAGEAFDKVAKMLNLPYPGGVYIDRLAQKGEPDKNLFPRPYIDNQNLDFSFSGLKTALSVHITNNPHLKFQNLEPLAPGGEDAPELAELRDVCASFTWSVCDTLRIKLQRALDRNSDVRSVIVAGGVAANTAIRKTMGKVAQERGLPLFLPSPALCTDNGAMVAHAGLCLARAGLFHGLDLEAVPRGQEVPWDYLGMD